MGWSTKARNIKGKTYKTGTRFKPVKNAPYYAACDASGPSGKFPYKSETYAYYYGKFTADYAKYPFSVALTESRKGYADVFVSKSVFPPAEYTIKYNLNGGSGTADYTFSSQTKYHGTDLELRHRKPTKAGHTFKGWGTSKTDTTPNYQPGDIYKGNSDITLYAIWEIKRYTVTYNANGGKCSVASNDFNHGAALTLPTPTYPGYTFVAWHLNTVTGTKLTTATTVTSSFTAVAEWKRQPFTITFKCDGGKFSDGTTEKTMTQYYKDVVEIPEVTREHYYFAGWVLTSGTGTLTTGTQQVTSKFVVGTNNAVLTAQWVDKMYYVIYDTHTNGGESTVVIGYNVGELLGSNDAAMRIPTKPYCTFLGWYTTPDGVDSDPIDLKTVAYDTSITTLYARFKEDQTTYVRSEDVTRPSVMTICTDKGYSDKYDVYVRADGAWKKAVVQT